MCKKSVVFLGIYLSCCAAGIYAQNQTKVHRPPITGFSHISLTEANDPAARKFYSDDFGWPVIREKRADGVVHYRVSAVQYIELVPPSSNFDSKGSVLNHIAFATPDAKGMRAYLKENGIGVPDKVTAEGNGRFSFITSDPEGNKIEFVQGGSPRGPLGPVPHPPVSTHIIHMGQAIIDADKMDNFYKNILGFHLYWKGWNKPGHIDWVDMQVPDGTDWIEYMLVVPQAGTQSQLRSADHFGPGVASVDAAVALLRSRGMDIPPRKGLPRLGDGKLKWNLYDPSGTRVELMEFKPITTPCCSPFTGSQPTH